MPDDKVKVSMFLAAPIAQAVKIRAAREGTGVSETIGHMFQCAHCREPITDEFIVGRPTTIAPNQHAVFFHKNRKECAEAGGPEVRFFLECPHCNAIPQQAFDKRTLRGLLDRQCLEFYCITCDQQWKASADELKTAAALLEKHPASVALVLETKFQLEEFHPGTTGCFIWGDASTGERVRFDIPPSILVETLGSKKAFADMAFCERKRREISIACQRAFRRQPGKRRITLEEIDFR